MCSIELGIQTFNSYFIFGLRVSSSNSWQLIHPFCFAGLHSWLPCCFFLLDAGTIHRAIWRTDAIAVFTTSRCCSSRSFFNNLSGPTYVLTILFLMFEAPELKEAATKLANWVISQGSQGPELEQTVMQRESGNPIFSFLFGGPFYDYYQWLKFTAITNSMSLKALTYSSELMRPDPATPPQEFLQSMFVLASQIQALKFAQPPNSLLLRQAATQVQQEIFRQVSGISGANVLFSQIKPATIAGAGFPPYGIPPAPFPGVFPPGMVFPQMTFAHPMQQMQLHQQQLQQQQLQQQIQQQQIQMQQQIQQQQIQQQQQQRRPLVRVKLPRDGDSLSEKQSAYFLSLLKNLQGSKPSIKVGNSAILTVTRDRRPRIG